MEVQMTLDHELIARARAVNIQTVATHYGAKLRKQGGGEYAAPCPLCGGHDRFSVSSKKALWNCRGCGKGGDVIDLVCHLDGCGFNDAIDQLTGGKSAAFDRVQHAKAKAEDAERQHRQQRKRRGYGRSDG
jgi:DNA primase